MSRRRFPNLIVVVVIAICIVAASSGFVSTFSSALGASSFNPASAPFIATQVASSDLGSCALSTEGAVKCWGQGPLGAGPGSNGSSLPVDVVGISDATSLAGGGSAMCAIVTSGLVKCWGDNSAGQLGDGTQSASDIPVTVTELTEPVKQVVVGASHACALTFSGGVKCWGRNDDQRLGDPTFPLGAISTTALSVLGLENGVTSIAAGVNHTCAVVNGGAKCWGRNDYSALGNGSSGELVQVQTMTTDVVAVGAGAVHSCALMGTGIVNCWGAGWGGGGLGRGNAGPDGDPVPGPVVNLTNAKSLSVTSARSCVVTTTDAVMCWGYNNAGSFASGDANSAWYNSPQLATGYPVSTQITGGDGHTCALTSRGKVRCSGTNYFGALGAGSVADQANGIDVVGIDGTPPPSPLKLMFDPVTTSCGTSTAGVSLSGSVNATIEWGDGASDVVSADGTFEHAYSDTDAHEISISGSAGRFSASTGLPGETCVTGVSQWGTHELTSLSSAFNGLAKLVSVPSDLPSSVTDVSSMFESTALFNQDISMWDTSNVTNMGGMFAWTQAFNQPLGSWDVSNVTNLAYTFNNSSVFNQPLDAWDTASVSSFRATFWGASRFDQALPSWSFSSARVAALWQFVGGGGLSRENFSTSLIGWASRPQNSGVMAYLEVEYLASASDAVANLRSKGWDIRGTYLYVPPTTTTSTTTSTTTTTLPPTTSTTTTLPPTTTTSTTTTTLPPTTSTTTTTTLPPTTSTTTTTTLPPTTTTTSTTTTTLPPTTTTTLPPPSPIYTVVFSCGDGSGSSPNDQTGLMRSTTVLPVSATPCGAPFGTEFAGWRCLSVDVDGGGNYFIAGDSMCTARWTQVYVPPPPTTSAAAIEPPPTIPPPTTPPVTSPPLPSVVASDPSVNNAAELAALNEAISSPTATSTEVQAAVSNLLTAGVTGSQATELATSPKVLESINSKQATAVFKEIPVGKLDTTQKVSLATAVSAAPEGVKNAFEGTIDVYGAGLDNYVPVGSAVDVGDRRTLVAAAAGTAVAGAAAAGAVGSGSGGSGSAPLPGNNALNDAQMAAVANRLSRGMLKRRSQNDPDNLGRAEGTGTMRTRAPLSKIMKRLARETAAIAFTIAGGVVVIFTLSGVTRKVAIIAMGTAFVLHVIHVVTTTKPD